MSQPKPPHVLPRETILRDEILRGLRAAGYCVEAATHDSGIPGLFVKLHAMDEEMMVIVGRPIPMAREPQPEDE